MWLLIFLVTFPRDIVCLPHLTCLLVLSAQGNDEIHGCRAQVRWRTAWSFLQRRPIYGLRRRVRPVTIGFERPNEVGPVTIAEFIEFGNNCVQPGYNYFSNLYIQEEGKLHNLYMAFKGAEIFDPLRVKEMSEDATILQADLLARFGFPEFTTEFLEGLKKEIPRYRRMARAHFEWNSLDDAEDYNEKRWE